MDTPKNALVTTGLTKKYFGNRVVRDVSMTVRRGEVYGLVGRNGAGKSTFMKLVCGLVLPTSGTVEVLGERMALGEAHPRVGSLVERPGVHPGMSGSGNLMCRALALGLTDPKAEVERVLRAVGIDERTAGERASGYSTGTRQRLGVALALMGAPDLLVLDEPFNGVDIEGTVRLRKAIVRLREERGATVLVSSHVVDQLERFVTRYGVMDRGRLVCEKTAEEVERACASCLCVRSSQPERALAVLQEAFAHTGAVICEDDEIRLDAGTDPADVTRTLVDAGLDVTGLYVRGRDVESYFAELMGRADGGERRVE